MHDAEEFWEELLAQIEAGGVIPVVGPELLTVVVDGRSAPLYRLLAERLLAKYGLTASEASLESVAEPNKETVSLRPDHELNDAVCALAQRGRRVQDLYRPINEQLKALVESPAEALLQPLRALASISGFKLFVTTTPDDLLARAIDAERYGGMAKTEHIVFAPKLASGALNDLPEVRSSGYTAVCYLFGKASPSPFVFAIHDEDTLEFLHTMQINAAESLKRLFSELRTQNLLLIGCNFADWLSRFFIRLANTQRLADNRGKREFLIEESADSSGSLTLFFERFSPDGTRVVTASWDRTARVWRADGTGEPVVLKGHESIVMSAAFSPDGTRVVTASVDKTARVWRADGTGEPVVLKGHEDDVVSAAFSPDGTRVVTASEDKTARVWRADGTGEPVVLKGHED